MRLAYRKGNLLLADERAIAHGCNARGKMGRGVAKAVADRYPGAFRAYMDAFASPEGLRLGTVVPWSGEGRLVLNLITQADYGRDRRHVDYDAVRACFRMVERGAARHVARRSGVFHEDPRLAIPRIGADRGGGDWDVLSAIVEEEVSSVQVTVYTA